MQYRAGDIESSSLLSAEFARKAQKLSCLFCKPPRDLAWFRLPACLPACLSASGPQRRQNQACSEIISLPRRITRLGGFRKCLFQHRREPDALRLVAI